VEAIQAHKTAPRLRRCWGPSDPGGAEEQALAGFRTSLNGASRCASSGPEKDELYKQIGQLKVELDFSKKELRHRLKTSAHGSIPLIPAHLNSSEHAGSAALDYYYQPQPESAETCA